MVFQSRERDVSSSLAEFAAGLEKACPGCVSCAATASAVTFVIDTPEACVAILATPGEARTIASLSLPTLRVHLEPRRGTPEAVDALIVRLDRSMHRGGG